MNKTPKLRFKEFSGDWEYIKLEDISTKIGDGIHATPKYVDISEIKFINGNNIKNHKISINENTKSISEDELKKYNIKLDDSSILMSINGTIGNVGYYNNEKVLLGKSVAYINVNSDNDKFFLGTLLETDKVQRKFMGELTGTTIKNLSLKSIRECNLYSPSLEEQEKIASFLSLIDDKISLQSEKVEALKDYKKGMMQKIFSRELRFKDDDGRDYPDWEEKKIGDICEVVGRIGFRGYTVNDIVNDPRDGALTLSPFNIIDQKLSLDKKTYISKVKYEESPEIKVYNGDIIFVKTASIGKLALVSDLNEDATINPQFCIFKNIKINNKYFYYLLITEYMQRQINRDIGGGVLSTLTQASIKNYNIIYPCIEEQSKIGDILFKLDTKIEKEQEKLDYLNEYKKGLLQQMFV